MSRRPAGTQRDDSTDSLDQGGVFGRWIGVEPRQHFEQRGQALSDQCEIRACLEIRRRGIGDVGT
jgi:hypothetical protein